MPKDTVTCVKQTDDDGKTFELAESGTAPVAANGDGVDATGADAAKPVAEETGTADAKATGTGTAEGMNGGKRKSKKSAKKSTRKSSTRKNKKSNKKGKKTQKGGSSLAHSDVNSSQSIATSVDNKLSLAGSIESGLFPGVQKITGGMTPTPKSMMGGANIPTPKSMMGGANTPTPKSMMGGENKKIGGGSGCSAKMLGGKKKMTSKK